MNQKLCTKQLCLFVLAAVAFIALALLICIVFAIMTIIGTDDQSLGIYKQSALASDARPCAEVGRTILLNKGSAVDAAIAMMLCMGVYNSHSSGIGGGTFIVVYNRSKNKAVVIDARERAPAGSRNDMFMKNPKLSIEGGLSVGVPGELKGLAIAHREYGKLPWSDLFLPAIRLAEHGFAVGMDLAHALRNQRDKVLASPSLREVFVNSQTGEILQEGDLLKRPLLAKTLRRIAQNGANEFYLGDTGKNFIKDLEYFGGIITAEDLEDYRAIVKDPTIAKLSGGLKLYSVPPPGSGYILSFILRVMDLFEMTKENLSGLKNSTVTYQRFIEALKYAYAYRSKLGDEMFVNLTEVISQLKSEEIVSETNEKITNDSTFEPQHYGAKIYKDDFGTAHLSVVAPNGDAVSATTTINYWFGAGIRSLSTGIIFNNEMDDFSTPNITNIYNLPPSESNFIQPGKRPQSSMCPTIIVNETGDVILAVGAAGGTRITSVVALMSMKVLWLGRNITDALSDPRIHHQLIPNSIEYEADFPQDILKGLEKIGHQLKKAGVFRSSVVGIHRLKDGMLMAASDPRRGAGIVSGF